MLKVVSYKNDKTGTYTFSITVGNVGVIWYMHKMDRFGIRNTHDQIMPIRKLSMELCNGLSMRPDNNLPYETLTRVQQAIERNLAMFARFEWNPDDEEVTREYEVGV